MRCVPRIDFVGGGAARASWLTGRQHGAVRLGWRVALGCAALALGASLTQLWLLSQVSAGLRATLTQREHQRQLSGRDARRPRAPVWSASQQQAVAAVVAKLNVDWGGLLDELERQTPPDVALIEIEPQAALGRLRLAVETRSAAALFAYLKALNASHFFDEARLASHESNDRDEGRPLRFSVWVGVAKATNPQPGAVR